MEFHIRKSVWSKEMNLNFSPWPWKTPDFLVVVKNVDDLYLCWWGEAVNRRSDLLLNPDLLQIRTMGDYEGDYCAADLLVWRDPLLCGQFIDLDALEKGRFCRRPYYKTITNSLGFFNTKLNLLLTTNMKRAKMAVQLFNSYLSTVKN